MEAAAEAEAEAEAEVCGGGVNGEKGSGRVGEEVMTTWRGEVE